MREMIKRKPYGQGRDKLGADHRNQFVSALLSEKSEISGTLFEMGLKYSG